MDLLWEKIDEPVILYGGCELFHDRTRKTEVRPALPFNRSLLDIVDYFDQPSLFWNRKVWEAVGPLDENLHFDFDWEWLLRAAEYCEFFACGEVLSRYRIHDAHKSGTGG